jgi:hypothetical protein
MRGVNERGKCEMRNDKLPPPLEGGGRGWGVNRNEK